jgi:hypothetical protein
LFDAVIHIATDQLEPTRITANIVIIVWIIAALTGWIKKRFRSSFLADIRVYLLLNLIFLAQNGLTNPEQGGVLRTTPFLLVLLTVALSALFTFRTPAISA